MAEKEKPPGDITPGPEPARLQDEPAPTRRVPRMEDEKPAVPKKRSHILLIREMKHPETGERLPAGRVVSVPGSMAERLVSGKRAHVATREQIEIAGNLVAWVATDPEKEE